MLSQKYRAWDGTHMRHVIMMEVIPEPDPIDKALVQHGDTTMQSTGKRDRSGKEIYEHDIITFKTVLGVRLYGVVRYNSERADRKSVV